MYIVTLMGQKWLKWSLAKAAQWKHLAHGEIRKIYLPLLTTIKREMKETLRGAVFTLIHAAVMYQRDGNWHLPSLGHSE